MKIIQYYSFVSLPAIVGFWGAPKQFLRFEACSVWSVHSHLKNRNQSLEITSAVQLRSWLCSPTEGARFQVRRPALTFRPRSTWKDPCVETLKGPFPALYQRKVPESFTTRRDLSVRSYKTLKFMFSFVTKKADEISIEEALRTPHFF